MFGPMLGHPAWEHSALGDGAYAAINSTTDPRRWFESRWYGFPLFRSDSTEAPGTWDDKKGAISTNNNWFYPPFEMDPADSRCFTSDTSASGARQTAATPGPPSRAHWSAREPTSPRLRWRRRIAIPSMSACRTAACSAWRSAAAPGQRPTSPQRLCRPGRFPTSRSTLPTRASSTSRPATSSSPRERASSPTTTCSGPSMGARRGSIALLDWPRRTR